MDQKEIYQDIQNTHAAALGLGQVELDTYLSGQRKDSRRGISLIIPCAQLGSKYQAFINAFHQKCPEQYFYPLQDLHITVFDYLPANEEYEAASDLDVQYIEVTKRVLRGFSPLSVEFKGIVFSSAAGIICGYDDEKLSKLRAAIRGELTRKKISFIERYASRTAHISFMRFIQQLSYPSEFLRSCEEFFNYSFGALTFREMWLVEHGWYNRQEKLRLIKSFSLC